MPFLSLISLGLCFSVIGFARDTLSWSEFQKIQKKSGVEIRIPEIPKTGKEMEQIAEKALEELNEQIEEIKNRDLREVNFNNTILALDAIGRKSAEVIAQLYVATSFVQNTEDYDLGDSASLKLTNAQREWFESVELRQRVEFFTKIPTLGKNEKFVAARLLDEFDKTSSISDRISTAKMSGLWKSLRELEAEYVKNSLGEVPVFRFSKKDLNGLSEEVLNTISKEGEYYLVPANEATLTDPILTQVLSKKIRHQVFNGRKKIGLEKGQEILKEILALRRELIMELGYKSWSHFQLQFSSKAPQTIVRELTQALRNSRAEFSKLVRAKKSEVELYYALNQQEQKASPPGMREYFEINSTIDGIFELCEELYGIKIVRIQEAPSWNSDVQMYAVQDVKEQTWLGVFALDLFPRANKDKWFWAQTLTYEAPQEEGEAQTRPFALSLGNFRPPADGSTHFMNTDDILTFAHELGHALHFVSRKSTYHYANQSNATAEFTEVPSTFLERLVMHPKILSRLSRHYKTQQKLKPEQLIEWDKARKTLDRYYLRNTTVKSLLDLQVHRSKPGNLAALEKRLSKEALLALEPDSSLLSGFAHIAEGYDSFFWTYVWSAVLANELVAKVVTEEGSLDPDVGTEIRKHLLEWDGITKSTQVLKKLFGRTPNMCSALLLEE